MLNGELMGLACQAGPAFGFGQRRVCVGFTSVSWVKRGGRVADQRFNKLNRWRCSARRRAGKEIQIVRFAGSAVVRLTIVLWSIAAHYVHRDYRARVEHSLGAAGIANHVELRLGPNVGYVKDAVRGGHTVSRRASKTKTDVSSLTKLAVPVSVEIREVGDQTISASTRSAVLEATGSRRACMPRA